MGDFKVEEPINEILIADNEHRRIVQVNESRWGELIIPPKNENPFKTNEGFRLVIFVSYLQGYMLLETLKEYERKYPDKLNIVALITDDPANPDAKISLKKRIWRLYNSEEKLHLEKIMIESALSFGIPCYKGEIKIEHFRKLLKVWNPDAIISCVFGQIMDAPIINFPAYGIYNFHPSDLADKLGAGPKPFEDLIERKADTTKFTIHQVTEKIDGGPIIAQSTPICVKMENGEMPDNVLVIDDKIILAIDHMVTALISELIRRKEKNQTGAIQKINFDEIFPESFKKKLMGPIRTNIPADILPVPDKDLFALL